MAIQHNRMVIAGTMPGGEVWSVNPTFNVTDGSAIDTFAQLQEWASNCASDLTTYAGFAGIRATLGTQVQINSFTAQYVNSAGILEQQAQATLAIAGTGTANKPFQTSVVCSLRTGRPGRSFRGRFYWPAVAVAISSTTLRVAAADALTLATGFQGLLRGIVGSGPAGAVLQSVVVSQTLSVATPTSTLQVGDVLDVQRRRRDAEQEVYTSVPV